MFNRAGTVGVLDMGTKEQKQKLYRIEELVASAAPVSLAPTTPERWRIYPRRNQGAQSSCVFHARAKAAGILQEMATGEFVEYSAGDYTKRSNAPSDGAYPIESFDLWRKEGIGLEALEPSNDVLPATLDAYRQTQYEKSVATVSALDAYYALPAYDFDAIVSTLHATKKPIPLGFYGTYTEWNRDIPQVIHPALEAAQAEVRHEVCATPNYGIYNGQEGFTIEDSWGSAGIGGTGVRWITRAFFSSRNYLPGLVPSTFKSFGDIGVDPSIPRHTFSKTLTYGMVNDSDVVALQDILKYEALFPANHASTGNYFEITRKGVLEWQRKYEVASEAELTALNGRTVGPKTIVALNKIYK